MIRSSFQGRSLLFFTKVLHSPVDDTVIITVGEDEFFSNTDKIPLRGFDYGRHFTDNAHGQNTYLWLIDDRRPHDRPKITHIGQGVCSPLYVIGFKGIVSGSKGQVIDRFGQANQVEVVCIFNHWNN